MNVNTDARPARPRADLLSLHPDREPVWEAPKMEDVSEQVMAQPYIRFT